MNYKLKNSKTQEEDICSKVEIAGFDYYVISTPEKDYEGYYIVHNKLFHTSKTLLQSGCKKAIATNNLLIDLPQVIDEVQKLAQEYSMVVYPSNMYSVKVKIPDQGTAFRGFNKGYNKSQETHPYSKEYVLGLIQSLKDYTHESSATLGYDERDPEDLLAIWDEQQMKTIYYD